VNRLTAFLLLLCVALARAGEEDGERIAGWILDLASPQHEVRERAEKRLLDMGAGAKGAVRRALADQDPEVRARAQSVWQALRWGDALRLAPNIERLVEDNRSGKGNSGAARQFVQTSGVEVVQAVGVLLESEDAKAREVAGWIMVSALSRYAPDAVARQMREAGPECIAFVRGLPASGGSLDVSRIVNVLNLLWRHEDAASVGLRALQRCPENDVLARDTMLAIRASGKGETIWEWLTSHESARAQFLLLASLADELGRLDEFAKLIAAGVPDGLKENDLLRLAELLAAEGYTKEAAELLTRASSPKLRYRRSRLLWRLGDREGAEAEWQLTLAKLETQDEMFSLGDQMDRAADQRSEVIWRKLLGDGKSKDVYASNACFRLGDIYNRKGQYGEAADFYESALERMQGALAMQVNGKYLSQDEALAHIRQMIMDLRAKAEKQKATP
jgi:tetratricopeptide (TPR) repeat protein